MHPSAAPRAQAPTPAPTISPATAPPIPPRRNGTCAPAVPAPPASRPAANYSTRYAKRRVPRTVERLRHEAKPKQRTHDRVHVASARRRRRRLVETASEHANIDSQRPDQQYLVGKNAQSSPSRQRRARGHVAVVVSQPAFLRKRVTREVHEESAFPAEPGSARLHRAQAGHPVASRFAACPQTRERRAGHRSRTLLAVRRLRRTVVRTSTAGCSSARSTSRRAGRAGPRAQIGSSKARARTREHTSQDCAEPETKSAGASSISTPRFSVSWAATSSATSRLG
ncbi:hypothetical protein HGI09_61250 [Streptomyces collinus]|nr:hypothetical protein HGI09_00010 [Streptomyces collinus]UJA18730.1 hypothetical protein HGI09_61250 [Streptomyces collinus]